MAWKVLCPVPRFFNQFIPNAPFLYPLKTENHVEKGVEKGCIGNKWVHVSLGISKFWKIKDEEENIGHEAFMYETRYFNQIKNP